MLRAESITKTYPSSRGDVVALDGVSLTLAPDARVGLVGPSGSGKSTLGQVVAMLLAPDRGSVTVDGDRVRGWGVRAPRDLRHRVQLLWQSPRMAVDPRLHLGAAIVEPLAASGLGPKRAAATTALSASWAERVGLTEDLLERFPHEVSEGQLQRACLARALILQPRYLICDELTSMLDVSTQAAVLEIIADVQAERDLGVLLITHDAILAGSWCHETVKLGELSHVEAQAGTSPAQSSLAVARPARLSRFLAQRLHSPTIGKCEKLASKPESPRTSSRTPSSLPGSTDASVPHDSHARYSRWPMPSST